jgi:hypothetical protein
MRVLYRVQFRSPVNIKIIIMGAGWVLRTGCDGAAAFLVLHFDRAW